jgi:hypothetical protein
MSAVRKKGGKKSSGGDDDDGDLPAPNPNLSETMQQCDGILKFLLGKPEAEAYSAPVDWEFYGLTDYPEIIKKPMDLGTIQAKMDEGKYPTPEKFAADVRLVWKNAMTYNRPDSEIYITADKLSKLFERKFAKLKKPGAPGAPAGPGGTKRKRSEGKGDASTVTRQDRLKFSQLVNQLSSDELGQLVDQIQRDCPAALSEEDEKEIEIEINTIDATTLLSLIDFAQQCVSAAASKKKNAPAGAQPSAAPGK